MAFTEKYVSAAGGGAHDGSSEANAWTLEEAIAAPATAGSRVNIMSDGTHTLTAARTLPSGTTENPIEWRGYNTTIGDLDSLGRNASTGELVYADFPLIDCTTLYRLTTGTYNTLRSLNITSGINNTTLTVANFSSIQKCRVVNTRTTGNAAKAIAMSTTLISTVSHCDCVIATNDDAGCCLVIGRGAVYGNYLWNSTATRNGIGIDASANAAPISRNVLHNLSVAINSGAFTTLIADNSWFNVATGISLGGDGSPVIAHNVGWSHTGYAIIGSTSSGNPLIWRNALGSYTSGRLDTTTLGSIIEENDSITLTADPFTDSTNKDFTLNNTSGGGLLCRAASRLWTGYGDLGAVQHQDAGVFLNTRRNTLIGR